MNLLYTDLFQSMGAIINDLWAMSSMQARVYSIIYLYQTNTIIKNNTATYHAFDEGIRINSKKFSTLSTFKLTRNK